MFVGTLYADSSARAAGGCRRDRTGTVFDDDHRGDLFAMLGVGHPEDERVADLRERLQHRLHFERRRSHHPT